MPLTAAQIKIFDKDVNGTARAILFSANGNEQHLVAASSITQVRAQLGEIKKKLGLRGVEVQTMLGVAYDGEPPVANDLQASTSPAALTLPAKMATFTVEQRFGMAGDILDIILNGDGKSAMLCGRGGTGKTEMVLQRLLAAGYTFTDKESYTLTQWHKDNGLELEQDEDALDADTEEPTIDPTTGLAVEPKAEISKLVRHYRGAIAPTELFKLLFHHQNDTIVFDDCDSAMDDENRVNLLKVALDTQKVRLVNWGTPFLANQGYPTSFEFKGKVIFVSNRPYSKVPQTIQSRSMLLNLDMTDLELCDWGQQIGAALTPDITEAQRTELFAFMREHVGQLKDFSLRTFIKAQPLMAKENWRDLALFAL